jgi:gamma-glutamyl:cysteine ligase YbdK (ATP-grasp superfamily)
MVAWRIILRASASRHGGGSMGHAEYKTGIVTGSVADLCGRFRFGIEEEYFLVDAETKAIAPTVPEALFAAVKTSTLGRGKGEFLQQQLEVATEPHVDMAKARAELRQLRHILAGVVASHGLGILAAGTHPTAAWTGTQQTKAERYDWSAQHAMRHARSCRAAGPRRAR